jgi:DNA gyrase/topoisomerase IV subunit A
MKIKAIRKIKSDTPINFYDITVNDYHNFSIGDSNIIVHNSSLEKAINKLARPFGNALQILEGYGFFGSEVSPSPAASRYTSVKLSAIANGILNKYSYLTTKDPDGAYDPFWMDVPLGLVSPIVGIAVGYKSTILPRKLKDIQEFLEGKRKSVKPYFEGFNGTIEKYKGVDRAWLLSSNITVENKKIMVREIPPILKYTAVLKKLDYLVNKYESNIRIVNNSNVKVNIDILYNGRSKDEWDDILNYVNKSFSIIVTENPIFIKDGQVLTYDSIEQYLEDYKWQVVRLKLKNTEYERNKLNFDLEFNEAKFKFILFILEKQRTDAELTKWLKPYNKEIVERLERLTSRKFTTDELFATGGTKAGLKRDLKEKEKDLKVAQKTFDKYLDPTIKRGISSKRVTINLFETSDLDSIENIAIWDGDDIYDEEIKNGQNTLDVSE